MKKHITMKANLLLIGASIIVLASCNSTRQATSGTSDDIYVTKTEATPPPTAVQQGTNDQSAYSDQEDQYNTAPGNSTSEQYKDADGTTYITNNYNGAYNDYGSDDGWYTTQMNHFYSPYVGFSYYSPYYMGFNYYDPFYYSPGLSISFGFGFGYGYNPWYSPYAYYPYYGYNPYWYNPYWYNPYYGYGCDYGYGYGGGYNNSYYGYHGSSSGNTSSSDGGRHYKLADGHDGDTQGQSGIGRGHIIEAGLQQPAGNQNTGRDVKQVDGAVKGNTIKRDPKDNSNVIDRNSAPNHNVTTPDRNIAPQRNGTSPNKSPGQNPRQTNFSQALIQSQQQSSNYHPQYSKPNTNAVVMNDQNSQYRQQTHLSKPSPSNVQAPVKQDGKKVYSVSGDKSSKSSNNSGKQGQTYQKPQQNVSHETVKQSSSQQRSDGGSRSNSQSGGQPASRGNNGGGNHNPR